MSASWLSIIKGNTYLCEEGQSLHLHFYCYIHLLFHLPDQPTMRPTLFAWHRARRWKQDSSRLCHWIPAFQELII